jgi:hypothetical protein
MNARIPNLNIYDPNWIAIKEYLQRQLEKVREMNDNVSLSEAETAALRGRILAYKELLAAEKDLVKAAARPPI